MARLDIKDMYEGRIIEINVEIRAAVNKKEWKTKAKLEADKKYYQDLIKKLG